MCKPNEVIIGSDFTVHLNASDHCYYYGVYTPGGYSVSDYNSMVQNFKKDISRRNNKEWFYRDKAVNDFASMLHHTLQNNRWTIVPCATSKPRNSLNFNDRLDATANKLRLLSSNYDIQFCLDTIEELIPSHTGGTRNPTEIAANTRWIQPTTKPNPNIVLFDDVLTTGAHFRAYKDIILSHYPFCNVIGIFLAKYDGSSIYDCDATPL